MTAVSHGGVSSRRLTSSVARARAGARLVRPSSRSRVASDAPEVTVAESVAVASPTLGIRAIPSSLGLRHIRVVLAGRRVRMGNGAFVMTVLALLTAMLGSLLFLNTALAETSFQLTNIRTDMRDLTVREQILSSELATAESPIGLEQQARAMGLVPAGSPLFLRLADGRILGSQTPAQAGSPLDIPPKYQRPQTAGESPAQLVSGDAAAGGSVTSVAGETAVSGSESATTGSGETAIGVIAEADR